MGWLFCLILFSQNFQANPFGKHGRCSQEISYCLATETPAKAELFKKTENYLNVKMSGLIWKRNFSKD